jgi:hypothetical protein
MEKETSGVEARKCLVCNCPGEGKVLLSAMHDNKQAWVCTKCLPVLIHGKGHAC